MFEIAISSIAIQLMCMWTIQWKGL